jgi:hypothetical protein
MPANERDVQSRVRNGACPSRFFMKKTLVTLFLVMLLLAAPEVAFGRSIKLTDNFCSQNPETVATSVPDEGDLGPSLARKYARAWEAMSMHGVWYTPKVDLQFYADAALVAYLARISLDRAVLPVYSPAAIHFRRGDVVFVSTGLILESHSEGELVDAIERDGGCPLFLGEAARFSAVQAKLALGIIRYYEASRPEPRRREVAQQQLRHR